MATEAKTTEQISEQMTKQMEQMFGLADMCRTQTEKATDFWMSQAADAVKESQKMVKEWLTASKTLSDEVTKAYRTQAREYFKLFAPAA